ncbi:hypothetical protein LR48_Vigan04g035100 [Vigna angularis]|uniref:Uncharacterized protein n=1 Tax=Phaseolus angularis TaxID=3914 RepID=A0A0L9UBL7_PHAAN|nr:hypothetical protein LR48_Vigan04g035100 [Vigna angularis]
MPTQRDYIQRSASMASESMWTNPVAKITPGGKGLGTHEGCCREGETRWNFFPVVARWRLGGESREELRRLDVRRRCLRHYDSDGYGCGGSRRRRMVTHGGGPMRAWRMTRFLWWPRDDEGRVVAERLNS